MPSNEPLFDDSPRNETNHHLYVSVEPNGLRGCSKEDCKLWGSGLLRVSEVKGLDRFQATVILTAAGCEVCTTPDISQRDIGPKISLSNKDVPRDQLTEQANLIIGRETQAFVHHDDME